MNAKPTISFCSEGVSAPDWEHSPGLPSDGGRTRPTEPVVPTLIFDRSGATGPLDPLERALSALDLP